MTLSGVQRREAIVEALVTAQKPISATAFATLYEVSRQVVVGDVALLRASGHEIKATTRGYILPRLEDVYVGKLPCKHTESQVRQELEVIVAHKSEMVDVTVDHILYGELTGQLNIKTKRDIDDFLLQQETLGIKLLSTLTYGIHIHTVKAPDEIAFKAIEADLKKLGILIEAV